jgi:hypothetical protein
MHLEACTLEGWRVFWRPAFWRDGMHFGGMARILEACITQQPDEADGFQDGGCTELDEIRHVQ